MAALDRRLAAHQEPFSLWLRLFWTVNPPERVEDELATCNGWWDKNCLYLDDAARIAFRAAVHHTTVHHQMRSTETRDYFGENWRKLMRAGMAIAAGADLPHLSKRDDAGEVVRLRHRGQGSLAGLLSRLGGSGIRRGQMRKPCETCNG